MAHKDFEYGSSGFEDVSTETFSARQIGIWKLPRNGGLEDYFGLAIHLDLFCWGDFFSDSTMVNRHFSTTIFGRLYFGVTFSIRIVNFQPLKSQAVERKAPVPPDPPGMWWDVGCDG